MILAISLALVALAFSGRALHGVLLLERYALNQRPANGPVEVAKQIVRPADVAELSASSAARRGHPFKVEGEAPIVRLTKSSRARACIAEEEAFYRRPHVVKAEG